MKIAIITDTHAGCRNNSLVFNDYFLRFYEEIFFPYLEKNQDIDTIIHIGDVFDNRKHIQLNILSNWREKIFERLEKLRKNVHIIVGNHDAHWKNSNEVNSPKELLSQYNWEVYEHPTTIDFDNLSICFLPWINESNYIQSLKEIQDTKAQVCMGHLAIQGFEMFAGHVAESGLDRSIFGKFDLVFSGHFHHKSNEHNIHYLGSPYPMTWGDYGDPRGFHIFDTDTRELQFIENPIQIFHKVYYNDSDKSFENITEEDYSHLTGMFVKIIVQKKENPYWYDLFLETIQKHDPADISIVDSTYENDVEYSDETGETKDTLTFLTDYVSELKLDSGEEELKQTLRDLYLEALDTNDQVQNS